MSAQRGHGMKRVLPSSGHPLSPILLVVAVSSLLMYILATPVHGATATSFSPAAIRANDASSEVTIIGTDLDDQTQFVQLEIGVCSGAGTALNPVSTNGGSTEMIFSGSVAAGTYQVCFSEDGATFVAVSASSIAVASVTSLDHSRFVADGNSKRFVVTGSTLSKSRDTFHLVVRTTACSGSSSLPGTSVVVDSSPGARNDGQLEVDITSPSTNADGFKLCVRFGSGDWFEFDPATGGDLDGVAVATFTADVLPVLPGVVTNVVTISGDFLEPTDKLVIVETATSCSGLSPATISGGSFIHSSGTSGTDQIFSAITSGIDASTASTYKLCLQPGGTAPAQFGDVNSQAPIIFVAVDSLNVATFVADGLVKHVVVSGNKMDRSRDSFKIVARTETCASGTAVGSATVDGAGGDDTTLDVDVSMSAVDSGSLTEYKLCVRLGSTAEFAFYDLSTSGANHLDVVKATSFVPVVLPVGADVASAQPLSRVLTVRGDGLLSSDEFEVVASADTCDSTAVAGAGGVAVSWASGIAGVEQVFHVDTSSGVTGSYKLCHRPTGNVLVEFGEVENSPVLVLSSASSVSPSRIVADGTVKRVVVGGAELDAGRDTVRVVARGDSCSSGASVGTATVDVGGATGTALDVDVSISAAAANGQSEFKLCMRFGVDDADRWYEFESSGDGNLDVVTGSSVAPVVVPVQPALLDGVLTLSGHGLATGDILAFVDTAVACTGTALAAPGGTPPVIAEDSVTGDTSIVFDLTTTAASTGDFKVCLLPTGAGAEYGEIMSGSVVTIVSVDSLDHNTIIADGTAKRIVVNGLELDQSRDSFILVAAATACSGASGVAGSSVVVAGGSATALDVDVSITVAGAGGATDFKLCVRHGSSTADDEYDFATAGSGDVTVVTVDGVAPTVLPKQSAALTGVLTVDGEGLQTADELVAVATSTACAGVSMVPAAGAPTVSFSAVGIAGQQHTYTVDTSSATAGSYKLCVRPADSGSDLEQFGEVSGQPTIIIVETTGVDHQRIVADGSAKIVMVSGSGLSKSRDSFQVVDRATGCSGSSAVAGSSAVVDSSSGASENGQLRVQVTLDVGTAEEVKLCVRYGGGAADEWYGFEPSTGGDLVAVSVSGFTADVVPVLPGVVSDVVTVNGQALDPSDRFVVVASATSCTGTSVVSASGASLLFSSGTAGADQVLSAVTSAVDASSGATYKLCVQPGGASPAQFGEVNGGAAILFVAVDSLDVKTFVADGLVKHIVVSGNKMDRSRDSFKIVARTETCASGTAVGSATVDGAGGDDTTLDVDVSMSAVDSGSLTEYKLCVRLGSTAEFAFYDLSTSGANHLDVVKATSFVPVVLPVGADVASAQPLSRVLTVRGDGLLSSDEFEVVASADTCDSTAVAGAGGVAVSWASGIAGVEQVFHVDTSSGVTGSYKLCHRPTGNVLVEFGEVENSPVLVLSSASSVSPSRIVADGTVKRVVVGGAELDAGRDTVRVVARGDSCSSGASVGTATVDVGGATGTALDVDVSISAAAANGQSEFKLCMRFGVDDADRWYEFESSGDGNLDVVTGSSVAPVVVPVQPALLDGVLTLSGHGLATGDILAFVDTAVACTGTALAAPGGTPPVIAEDSVTGDTSIVFDLTTTAASTGDFKVCLLPTGAGAEYGEIMSGSVVTIVSVDSLDHNTIIADGTAKRIVVNGLELDQSRDSFILVAAATACSGASGVAGSSVVVAGGSATALDVDVSITVAGAGGATDFKLCVRHGSSTADDEYDFATAGSGDVTVVTVDGVAPTVLPKQSAALTGVLTVDGEGLQTADELVAVATSTACAGVSMVPAAGAPTVSFSAVGIAGQQHTYTVDTSSATAGSYKLCVRPADSGSDLEQFGEVSGQPTIIIVETTGVDHQRIVADGSAKIVMVSGSGLSKSRDSFQVVDRATGCSGSSAVAGSSAVVDSSSGASENGQLRVQVTLDVGTAEEVKLCVRYGGGAADEWYGFEPSTGGDLVAVSVSGFTADVVPVLPDLLSAAITLSGQQLSPLDTVVVVSSVTPCSGCFMESVDGISVYHSSGVLGGPQSFSVQTTGFDASVATVLKLCIRPGVGEAQFGEVAGSQALSLVQATSLNVNRLVADGTSKRLVVNGFKLSNSRDEFKVVSRSETCSAGSAVGSVSVDVGGPSDTSLNIDVSIPAASVSTSSEFKLCIRLKNSVDPSFPFYDFSSLGANHLIVTSVESFAPVVLPIASAASQPLTSVLTLRGLGLLASDSAVVVSTLTPCTGTSVVSAPGVALSYVSRVPEAEVVFSVNSASAFAGVFKICLQPNGVAPAQFGEVDNSSPIVFASAVGLDHSVIVADGTPKAVVVSGSQLDKSRDVLRVILRSESCGTASSITGSIVTVDSSVTGATGTSLDISVSIPASSVVGVTNLKLCIKYGATLDPASRWYGFDSAAGGDLVASTVNVPLPMVLPIQPSTLPAVFTVRGDALASTDVIQAVAVATPCSGTAIGVVAGAPLFSHVSSAAGEEVYTVDTTSSTPGNYKLCVRPRGTTNPSQQFGELVGSPVMTIVRLDSLDHSVVVADGLLKRVVVQGASLDPSRDTFHIVARATACFGSSAFVGSSAVVNPSGPSGTSLEVDVSLTAAAAGAATEFKLCAKFSTTADPAFLRYQFSTPAGGDIDFITVQDVSPRILPAFASPLIGVLTISGNGLDPADLLVFVSQSTTCSGTSVAIPAGAPVASHASSGAGSEVYTVSTAGTSAGTFKLCTKPRGNSLSVEQFGELVGSPIITIATVASFQPSAALNRAGASITVTGTNFPPGTNTINARLSSTTTCSGGTVLPGVVGAVTSTSAIFTADLSSVTSGSFLTVCVAVDNAATFVPVGAPQSLRVASVVGFSPSALRPGSSQELIILGSDLPAGSTVKVRLTDAATCAGTGLLFPATTVSGPGGNVVDVTVNLLQAPVGSPLSVCIAVGNDNNYGLVGTALTLQIAGLTMFQPEAAVATNGVSLTVIGQSFPTGTDTMKARLVDGPNCSTGAVYSADVGLVTSTTAVLTTDLTGATSALPLTVCVAVDNANDFAPAGRPQSLDVVVPTALDPGIVDITSTDLIEFGIAGTSLSASDVVVVLSDITQSCSSPGDIAGGIVTESTLSFDGTKLRVQIQPGNPVSSTNKVCLQVRGEGNFFEIGSNSLVGDTRTPPSTPSLTVVRLSPTSLRATFGPPLDFGGPSLTNSDIVFELQLSLTPDFFGYQAFLIPMVPFPGTITIEDIDGFSNGQYYARGLARNLKGDSPLTTSLITIFLQDTPLVTDFELRQIDPVSVRLRITELDDRGEALTGVEAQLSDEPNFNNPVTIPSTRIGLELVMSGTPIAPKATFYFRVAGINGAGQGPFSPGKPIFFMGYPSNPEVTLDAAARDALRVRIRIPSDTGGGMIDSYQIRLFEDVTPPSSISALTLARRLAGIQRNVNFDNLVSITNTTTAPIRNQDFTSYFFEGLNFNRKYVVFVNAENALGFSSQSSGLEEVQEIVFDENALEQSVFIKKVQQDTTSEESQNIIPWLAIGIGALLVLLLLGLFIFLMWRRRRRQKKDATQAADISVYMPGPSAQQYHVPTRPGGMPSSHVSPRTSRPQTSQSALPGAVPVNSPAPAPKPGVARRWLEKNRMRLAARSQQIREPSLQQYVSSRGHSGLAVQSSESLPPPLEQERDLEVSAPRPRRSFSGASPVPQSTQSARTRAWAQRRLATISQVQKGNNTDDAAHQLEEDSDIASPVGSPSGSPLPPPQMQLARPSTPSGAVYGTNVRVDQSDLMMMARPSRTPRAPQSPSNNGLVALLRRNLSASGKRGSGGAGSRPVSGSAPSRTLPPSTTSPPGQVPTARSPSPRSSPGVSESNGYNPQSPLPGSLTPERVEPNHGETSFDDSAAKPSSPPPPYSPPAASPVTSHNEPSSRFGRSPVPPSSTSPAPRRSSAQPSPVAVPSSAVPPPSSSAGARRFYRSPSPNVPR